MQPILAITADFKFFDAVIPAPFYGADHRTVVSWTSYTQGRGLAPLGTVPGLARSVQLRHVPEGCSFASASASAAASASGEGHHHGHGVADGTAAATAAGGLRGAVDPNAPPEYTVTLLLPDEGISPDFVLEVALIQHYTTANK
jgi:hypothetical protein